MAEQDALGTYQFPKNQGLFTAFEDGDEFKIRVLTTDPVVSTKEFTAPSGEINIVTKFAFIIYNFTLGKAQILNAGATITKEIQRIHQDPDFGGNIKLVDIKITATGNKLTRKYTINVLPKTETLTNEQIKECQAIDLDEKIENGTRMSFYDPKEYKAVPAIALAEAEEKAERELTEEELEEPINLDNIPF